MKMFPQDFIAKRVNLSLNFFRKIGFETVHHQLRPAIAAGMQPCLGQGKPQLVIAWTVAQPGVSVALCGARKVSNAVENAAAGAIELEPDDVAFMRQNAEAIAPLHA